MRSQVEATKGALWDAFAEVAVYMEVLRVRVSTAAPASAKGERPLLPLPDSRDRQRHTAYAVRLPHSKCIRDLVSLLPAPPNP